MKKTDTLILAITMLLALSQVSSSEDALIAKAPINVHPNFSVLGASKGNFCSIHSLKVCVLTQSNEDCLKLGGHKVADCRQMIEHLSTDEHSDQHDSCMANEDLQEPASCYGF